MKTKILSPLRRDGYKAGMIMMLIALSTMLLTTACGSEDDLVNNTANTENTINKGYALPVTVNVTREGDAGTRATYTDNGNGTGSLAFSTGDKLFVSGNDASAGGAGFFAGTLDWVSDGTFRGTLTLQNTSYTGTADALLTAASSGGSNYVSAQLLPAGYEGYPYLSIANSGYNAFVNPDASKAFAPSKKLGVEQLSWEYANSYSSGTGFTLAPQNAILNFTISGLTASTEVTATLKEGSFSFVSGNVTTNSSGIATFAMGLTGGKYDLHDFTLTVGGHDFPLASSSKEAQAGKIYNITRSAAPTYTLLSAATTADYGKVVCAAGHLHDAKTAVPTGCTAVGILGKVTETGHGLILALQDAPAQKWNTINGWTSVTTYAGTTLKQLPDNAALGGLTSYATLGSTTVSNWCVAQKSDYEAIFINLGSAKHDDDGYTYDDNVNAYITTDVGGTAISGDYWSATEYDVGFGRYFNSDYWYWYNDSNGIDYSLRPVLGF